MLWLILFSVGTWAIVGAKFLDASIDPFAGNTNFVVQVTDSLKSIRSAKHVMRMADSGGKLYECAMPEKHGIGLHGAKPSLQDAEALMQRLQRSGHCFRRSEGYWAYEVCPGSHVRQYHQEGTLVQQEFVLGVMHTDELELQVKEDPSVARVSISEKYTRGQVCDLTGHDRTVVVHYICSHAGSAFLSIEEILSCQYVAILGTPEVCKMGNIKESTLHVIECALAEAEASGTRLPAMGGTSDSSSADEQQTAADEL